jgi:hypothetical protein
MRTSGKRFTPMAESSNLNFSAAETSYPSWAPMRLRTMHKREACNDALSEASGATRA